MTKDMKSELKEEEPESLNEGIIVIITYLLIQWFDKKFNSHKSLVR